MKRIKLTQGKFAIVDAKDYAFLNSFRWYAAKSRNVFYVAKQLKINGKNRMVYMHHLILGYPLNKKQVDHVDGNGLNNRRENIRIVTSRENTSNHLRRRMNRMTSRFTGVFRCPPNRWKAQIVNRGKSIHLGCFGDEAEASNAYQSAFRQIEGKNV